MKLSLVLDNEALASMETAPLRSRQIFVLGATVLLSGLDGYDALSMAYAAPAVSLSWHLGKALLGLLLASSLLGMAFGSLFLSPLADRLGRRPVVLGALAVMTLSALLSAACTSAPELAACRILTGVAIGVMVAMTTLIAAEFANARRRALSVATTATLGFALGGILGGLASSALLRHLSWPWVFLLGAALGALLLVMLALGLPESPAFLAARRGPDALAKLNRVLTKLGHRSLASLPPAADRRQASYAALFDPGMRSVTLRLMAINILVATSAYYLLSWLPQMVADAGFTPATASLASAMSGLVGVVGGLIFGALAGRFEAARLAAIAMVGMALALAGLGFTPRVLPVLFAAAATCGFFISGTTGVFYALLAASFSSLARASGLGLVMGAGRVFSALGPALAGLLFASGATRLEVSLAFAVGPLVAAALTASLSPRKRAAV